MNSDQLFAPGYHLYIVDKNPVLMEGLRNYLINRFGALFNISTFPTVDTAIEKIDEKTDIVLLEYPHDYEKGNEAVATIKKINPRTEIILLTSHEDIGDAIDTIRSGKAVIVVKGHHALAKITNRLSKLFMYPVYFMEYEMGINKYLAMFFLTFAAMAISIYIYLIYLH